MTFTHSALWPYLYGQRVEREMVNGDLSVRAVKNQSHAVPFGVCNRKMAVGKGLKTDLLMGRLRKEARQARNAEKSAFSRIFDVTPVVEIVS